MKPETLNFIREKIVEERKRCEACLLDAARHGFSSTDARIIEYQKIAAIEDDFYEWMDEQEEGV